MLDAADPNVRLIEAVRAGDERAWQGLIDKFEGRLLAFAESRLRDRSASEDIVQDTFIGFLTSLPNYDSQRPLEGYLFSICAYKLTDYLRKTGRRPPLASQGREDSDLTIQLPGSGRVASSIARSVERKHLEEEAIAQATHEAIQKWKKRGEWKKLGCLELLIVCGLANKEVAQRTGFTEQQVAILIRDFYNRLKSVIQRSGLDTDVFPELRD
ncbi:MAG: RNA polymerase sigma factor [Planctomycetaceae bacterium]